MHCCRDHGLGTVHLVLPLAIVYASRRRPWLAGRLVLVRILLDRTFKFCLNKVVVGAKRCPVEGGGVGGVIVTCVRKSETVISADDTARRYTA